MQRDRFRPTALALAAGASLGLALPGPGLAPLVLLVPGLLRRSLAGASGRTALGRGFLAGTVQWLVAVPWVTIVLARYGHSGWLLAGIGWVLMSAILGLTWAIAGWAASRTPERWRPWSVPLALAAVEVLQSVPPWNFPWNPVAAVATPVPALLAPLPVVGAAGLSLILLMLGGGLDALADRSLRMVGAVQLGVVAAVAVAAVLGAPTFRPTGAPLRAAALQPDVPLEVRWDPANETEIERRVWDLSAQAVRQGARWVVWPESAIPRVLEHDPGYRSEIETFAREHDAWLYIGSIGIGPGEGEYGNSVFAATPAGVLPVRYDKVHLVPFGEYVPLLGRLAFFRPLVREVGAFTPGTRTTPLPGPGGSVGVAVCYEVAFPSLYAAEVRQGAEILITITNDGWYGDSAAPRQHLALAVLRAAENRRWLVRAANTGISAIIDPSGRVVERLGFGRRGLISGQVTPGGGVTPSALLGGWLRLGIVAAFAGAIVAAACRRRR